MRICVFTSSFNLPFSPLRHFLTHVHKCHGHPRRAVRNKAAIAFHCTNVLTSIYGGCVDIVHIHHNSCGISKL